MQRFFRLSSALALVITTLAFPTSASAGTANHIVISQVETATTSSASQEFIELYNPAGSDVPVNAWTIDYKSATSSDTPSAWVKHADLGGTIKAYSYYLVAPKSFLAASDADWSATLASSGGTIRVRDSAGTVIDQLGYGTANAAEGGIAPPAPAAGQSLERLPGRLDAGNGNGVDSDNNGADFILQPIPDPKSTLALPQPPGAGDSDMVIPPASEDEPVETPEPGTPDPAPQNYAPLDITELLINPMSPLTDAADEFIELFNPTDSPVSLAGYTIRAGSNFHSYYVLPSATLAPGAYLAFYSAQTKVAMTNSGGAVEVLDPAGNIVDVTPAYGTAPEGQSWARFDDGWHWTLQTSAGQPNVLATAVTLVVPAKTKTPKAKAAKKVVVKKPKAPKKAYIPHPRTKKPKAMLAKAPIELTSNHSLQPAGWLLIGLALLTIGYALYEFRFDIHRFYLRCRRNDRARPNAGPPTAGGGRD